MDEALKIELLQAQIELQQYLYTRLGLALHDEVAQLLGSVNMLLGATMNDISLASETLHVAQVSLRAAIQEIRILSQPMQDILSFNSLEYLQREVDDMNASRTVPVKLIRGRNELSLPAEEQVMLFCILLDIVRNYMTSGISIRITANTVEVAITDATLSLPEKVLRRIRLLQGTYHSGNGFRILLPF
jgi:signal transduction histidine kinase